MNLERDNSKSALVHRSRKIKRTCVVLAWYCTALVISGVRTHLIGDLTPWIICRDCQMAFHLRSKRFLPSMAKITFKTVHKEKGEGGGTGSGGKRLTCDQAIGIAGALIAAAGAVLSAPNSSPVTAALLVGYAEGLMAGACPS